MEFARHFRLRFVSAPRPHFWHYISYEFIALSGFQPNYAIKRDLRENTGFKFHIRCVGTLFWLLDPQEGTCVI